MPPKKFSLKVAVIDVPDGKKIISSTEVNFGVPWSLCVEHEDGELAAYLHCKKKNDEEKPWSIETKYEFRLVSVMRKIKKSQSFERNFIKNEGYGTAKFFDWNDAVGENTANKTAVIQCDVTINKMTGIAPKKLRSFEEPEEHLTDVVLKVGEQKFHVSKAILAAQSPYFKTLFFGNFDEAKKPEIELKDVDADIFQVFLEIFYGDFEITADTVAGLLELGDKFDVPVVQKRCEEFLLGSEEVESQEKLRLADTFKLENLMSSCLNSIDSSEKLRADLPTNLADLTNSSLIALFEKTLSLYQ